MEALELRLTSNGYILQLDNDRHREYVFKSTEVQEMLEFIGKHVHGRRVKVELQ